MLSIRFRDSISLIIEWLARRERNRRQSDRDCKNLTPYPQMAQPLPVKLSPLSLSWTGSVNYALKNTPYKVVIRKIRQSVDASEKRLPSLSAVFDRRSFPPPVKVLSKCAQCKEDFDPNYNTKRSCIIWHDPNDWDYHSKYYSRRKGLRYNWSCAKCEKRWQLSGLDVAWDRG